MPLMFSLAPHRLGIVLIDAVYYYLQSFSSVSKFTCAEIKKKEFHGFQTNFLPNQRILQTKVSRLAVSSDFFKVWLTSLWSDEWISEKKTTPRLPPTCVPLTDKRRRLQCRRCSCGENVAVLWWRGRLLEHVVLEVTWARDHRKVTRRVQQDEEHKRNKVLKMTVTWRQMMKSQKRDPGWMSAGTRSLKQNWTLVSRQLRSCQRASAAEGKKNSNNAANRPHALLQGHGAGNKPVQQINYELKEFLH